MSAIRSVIDRLGTYFEPTCLNRLNDITTVLGELTPEQSQFLADIRGQVQTLLYKLTTLKALSFHSLQDVENVGESLKGLKIDLPLLGGLNSETTRTVVDQINTKIDEVASHIDEIRGQIGKQKARVAKLIKENQDAINDFLQSAGYRYSVQIQPSADLPDDFGTS